jgi:hypothetical protein
MIFQNGSTRSRLMTKPRASPAFSIRGYCRLIHIESNRPGRLSSTAQEFVYAYHLRAMQHRFTVE